ncbi:MAG: thiol-activated cytolysin family protein [Spirochaetes bacterium]|nr:thiol-activated cytolysin family protein [Spirochaetota bacterium]MBU0956184.1 thiol-activated cytolysin family protein [Spirochaetota bacterium]
MTLVLVIISITACTSAAQRSRQFLASGDYSGAIEQLAPALTRKPEDKDARALFEQIYPSIMETLKADALRFRESAMGDTVISDRLVTTLEQLWRIQKAVLPMPAMIGDKRSGFSPVQKYPDNFAEQLSDAKLLAAESWYAQADQSFPGQTRIEKEALIRQYETAFAYVPEYRDTRERIARLAYQIAEDYEVRGTIPELRKAVEWLDVVEHWATNYLDSGGRRQMLAHRLGQLLKAEGTRAAYNEAYLYFRTAGNYDNAAAEVQLYEFNRQVLQLPNEAVGRNKVTLINSANHGTPRLSNTTKTAGGDNPFVKVRTASVQSSRLTLFTPDNLAIYPGAVFEGSPLPDFQFRPLSADRMPLQISLATEGRQGLTELMLPDPAQGARVRASINEAMQAQAAELRPRLEWRLEPFSTAGQLQLALGFGHGKESAILDRWTQLATAANQTSSNQNLTYAILEVQVISHTVQVDEPRMPADFFAAQGAAIVAPVQAGMHAPYYVSGMQYGQQTWILLASGETPEKLREQLAALLQAGRTDTVRTAPAFRVLDQVSGDGRQGSIRDSQSLRTWVYSRLETGGSTFASIPLSFQLRSLKDNAVASFQQTMEMYEPAQLRLIIVPTALQLDRGMVNQLALKAYASGGLIRPQNPEQDPDRTNTATSAWQAAFSSGEMFVTMEGKGDSVRWLLDKGKAYTSIASSLETPVFVGLKAGYRQPSGDIQWQEFQFLQLTAGDILQDRAGWQSLRNEGLYFSSPDFAGRLFFDISLESLQ